ncbi:MAG: hypothetical protein QM396_07405 [Euryarchaeota archaeon]|nr:hypothetical protein [Euryarchaeota archaeon]HHT18000.1 hypothetical protein [Methanobacterium sp.]
MFFLKMDLNNILEIFPKLRKAIYEKKFRITMTNHEIQTFQAAGIKRSEQCPHINVYPWDGGLSVHWRHDPQYIICRIYL